MTLSFKKIVGKLHLVLGLSSGLVVFIVSITGCIYAFQKEIQDLTQDYRYVEAQDAAYLPPSILVERAEEALEGRSASRVYYETQERAAYVLFLKDGEYYTTYLNPYTGEVLKVKNMRQDFFTIILYLHMTLLLPYGEHIVGISTIIFFIMLVSGIILWWPKNKAGRKQRFTVKWNARWRRKNYDLHNVLGFYMTWVSLFVTITGLVFAYGWMKESVYWLAGGGDYEEVYPVSDPEARTAVANPVDKAWRTVHGSLPQGYGSMVLLPTTDTAPIYVLTSRTDGTFSELQYHYFDQYTAERIDDKAYFRTKPFTKASVAEKIIRMNYDIHTGGIFGFAGKLLAFFASLVAASLPVTGFMIWRGRRKKKGEKRATPQKTGKKKAAAKLSMKRPKMKENV
ncbi:PepSY-associated TM helix domain-containing protein [Roseivirga sp. BDSF3-8]|uniref:PepSY-associated TM helix domain-containing protein n=1 Tax=Roseivirga sp. BDSF3-8 TaxID=3241598 RepID=UPI00353217FD